MAGPNREERRWPRSYTGGRFALALDSTHAGLVSAADGGHPTGELVTSKIGVDNLHLKTVGNCKFEDISITCGTAMSQNLYEWIKASFDKIPYYQDGAIMTCDERYNVRTRMEFQQALITEVGFPALDGGNKSDDAKLNVKFRPTRVKVFKEPGNQQITPSQHEVNALSHKMWSPRDFRIRIDGMPEQTMLAVNKIDGITLKQKYAEDACGEHRIYDVVPSSLDVPNLIVTLSEAFADPFYDWHEQFVVNGMNHLEKGATLEYLSPARNVDAKTGKSQGGQGSEVLFTLNFHNLGILKLTPEKVESNSEQVRRIKAEMYCEWIEFKYNPKAVFA